MDPPLLLPKHFVNPLMPNNPLLDTINDVPMTTLIITLVCVCARCCKESKALL